MRHVALLMHLSPADRGGHPIGELELSNLDTMAPLAVLKAASFVVTLELDSDMPYVRGQLQLLPERTSFPIQGSAALFAALSAFIARVDEAP